jgi:hypothetical protein
MDALVVGHIKGEKVRNFRHGRLRTSPNTPTRGAGIHLGSPPGWQASALREATLDALVSTKNCGQGNGRNTGRKRNVVYDTGGGFRHFTQNS